MSDPASASSEPSEAAASDPVDIPVFPEFRLAVFDEGDDGVALVVGVLEIPSIKRHASPALLYGLAIMTLDQTGVVARTVNELLSAGPISEIDACNRIALLLQQEANVEPV